jgi:cytochrome c oxidase accessory protein FixG
VRRIEGWKGARRPARVAAWRSALLHAVLALLCVGIGFHLVGYFRSPYDMLASLASGEISRASFGFLAVASALAYVDFVWVRQTFCKFLCPYARFQGVLFDRNTLVVGYDARRGEPRGKKGRASGDCVDCGLCVAVCPTGIDIRAGLQLECIACTQCIDACNAVMERVKRPRNLIGYAPLEALEGGGATRVLRPRVVAYGTLLVAVGIAFAGLLARRLPMDLQVEHNRSALSSRLPDGRLGNAFTLHIENRDRSAHEFRVRVEDGAGRLELIAGRNPLEVAATSAIETRVFVVEPRALRGEEDEEEEEDDLHARPIRFVLERVDDTSRRVVRSTHFLALEGHSDD